MDRIKTGGGKYETGNDNGRLYVYRNGMPWLEKEKDLVGDGYVLSLVQRIEDLESKAAVHQPDPKGRGRIILELVREDFELRAAAGLEKYGTELRAYNGRDALMDAYQEAVDLCMYLRQAMYERDGK
jgi:hypothetical protein